MLQRAAALCHITEDTGLLKVLDTIAKGTGGALLVRACPKPALALPRPPWCIVTKRKDQACGITLGSPHPNCGLCASS